MVIDGIESPTEKDVSTGWKVSMSTGLTDGERWHIVLKRQDYWQMMKS